MPADLRPGPFAPLLEAGIDPRLAKPRRLSRRQTAYPVAFVRDALFDERVLGFCALIPAAVPSGRPLQRFEGCD